MIEVFRKCPFCKEEIARDAIKCKHCKEMLGESSMRFDPSKQARAFTKGIKEKEFHDSMLSAGIAVALFISFILWRFTSYYLGNNFGLGLGLLVLFIFLIGLSIQYYKE